MEIPSAMQLDYARDIMSATHPPQNSSIHGYFDLKVQGIFVWSDDCMTALEQSDTINFPSNSEQAPSMPGSAVT